MNPAPRLREGKLRDDRANHGNPEPRWVQGEFLVDDSGVADAFRVSLAEFFLHHLVAVGMGQ